MDIAKLSPGLIWHNSYTIETPIGQGSMAYVYKARVNLETFDFPNLISYWEAQKENVTNENIKAYCNYRKDIWSCQSREEWLLQCKKNNICYPEMGVCALKILKPTDHIERFFNEWQNTIGMYDPHLLQVYGGGEFEGFYYYAMEFIDNPYSLADLYKIPLEDKVKLIAQAAKGLDSLHKINIIHRDVKLDNLIVFNNNGDLHLKIADLGVAKDFDSNQTKTSQILGTPNFMSPEQVKNSKSVNLLSDVYSLGATFYELVSEQPPYNKQTLQNILYNINQGIAPISVCKINPEIPKEIDSIVLHMMEPKLENRPQNMDEVQKILKDYLNGEYKIKTKVRTKVKSKTKNRTTKGIPVQAKRKRTESYKKVVADEQKAKRETYLKALVLLLGPTLLILYLLFADYFSNGNENRGLKKRIKTEINIETSTDRNKKENTNKNETQNINKTIVKKQKIEVLNKEMEGLGEWFSRNNDSDWLGVCPASQDLNIDPINVLLLSDLNDWEEYQITFDAKVSSGIFSFGVKGLSERNIFVDIMRKLGIENNPNIWYQFSILVTKDKMHVTAEESPYANVGIK